MDHDDGCYLERPDERLKELLRGAGSKFGGVVEDGIRRLDGEPAAGVRVFSQSVELH